MTPLWSKAELEESEIGTWVLVTVDISALAGQTVQLAWTADTIDGTEKIEIDLVNGVFKVNGVDRLAGRRQRLGI